MYFNNNIIEFLEKCNPYTKVICETILNTGLKVDQLIQIKVENVLQINKLFSVIYLNYNKYPLPNDLKQRIISYNPKVYLFENGNNPHTRKSIFNLIYNDSKKLNIKISSREFRKEYIKNRIVAGIDPLLICRQLGIKGAYLRQKYKEYFSKISMIY